MIVSVTLPQPNAGERSAYRRVDCARPCRAVFPVIGPCPSLFWANSFPVITISSKMLFVPVNAGQLVPPTGIFETVGGGFPVFFPVPRSRARGSHHAPLETAARSLKVAPNFLFNPGDRSAQYARKLVFIAAAQRCF